MKEWLVRAGLPPLGRLGLAIAALAGLLVAISPALGDAASGPAAVGEGETSLAFAQADVVTLIVIGLMAFAVIGACAYSTRLWVHLAGVVLATAAGVIYVQVAAGARTSDRFAEGSSATLDGAGIAIASAFVITIVGIVLALTHARLIPPNPDLAREDAAPADSRPSRSATATSGLVLSILGVLLPFAAAAGVMVSSVALTDIRTGGAQGGRAFGLAGLVIGAVLVTVYATIGVVQVTTAQPG